MTSFFPRSKSLRSYAEKHPKARRAGRSRRAVHPPAEAGKNDSIYGPLELGRYDLDEFLEVKAIRM